MWPSDQGSCLRSKRSRSSRTKYREKEFSHSGRAENGALFVVAPFSARPSRGPILRSARTGKGTLGTQAIRALDY